MALESTSRVTSTVYGGARWQHVIVIVGKMDGDRDGQLADASGLEPAKAVTVARLR